MWKQLYKYEFGHKSVVRALFSLFFFWYRPFFFFHLFMFAGVGIFLIFLKFIHLPTWNLVYSHRHLCHIAFRLHRCYKIINAFCINFISRFVHDGIQVLCFPHPGTINMADCIHTANITVDFVVETMYNTMLKQFTMCVCVYCWYCIALGHMFLL